MMRGKEFADLPDTRLHCLPQVMKDHGYATSFDSASDGPFFEAALPWLERAGFDEVRFAPDRHALADPAIWNVGVEDDVFYQRYFAALDERMARAPGVPQFAVLANVSHHYPFDKSPHHVPTAGYPTKYQRNYVASLTEADGWLATFFAELDRRPAFNDAIVILVGDHSFPADEHGIHFNGLGSFEESFHTVFSLRWRGHVTAEDVRDRAASQIDVAPTILDLLQIQERTHFVGTSLFADGVRPPVPLVQPYDGIHIAAVEWPFKLVRHESAQQQHLYDLSADPGEEHDRADDPALAAEVSRLGETLTRIRTSEALLRANRVWPRGP
jgi:phosphoglycerol transferase MdoB-like AlkP superfamily enzyme